MVNFTIETYATSNESSCKVIGTSKYTAAVTSSSSRQLTGLM
jgi:hypothetical protein